MSSSLTASCNNSKVRAISLQDSNPGGRIWITKIYDQQHGKGIEGKLLSINSQRMSLSQKSLSNGAFYIGDSKFSYVNIQGYLLVVVVAKDFNIIRENNLIKSLKSFVAEFMPVMNPETISEQAIMITEGWNEVIADGEYFPFPYTTLNLLKMHSLNEELYDKQSEMAMLQKEEEYKAQRRDERIQRGKSILRNIKQGVKLAVSEAGMVDDFESFSLIGKRTKSVFLKHMLSSQNTPLIPKGNSKVVELNSAAAGDKSKEKFTSISKMMNKTNVSTVSSAGRAAENQNGVRSRLPVLPDGIQISKVDTYTLDSDCNVMSSISVTSLDIRYASEEATKIKICSENLNKCAKLKTNPKVKKDSDDGLLIPISKTSSSVKVLKYEDKLPAELPFPITSWINHSVGGQIEDVLLEFDIAKYSGTLNNLELVLQLSPGCSEPNFKSLPMGEVKYDAGQNSVIWQLDFVDKSATESQIIEFSSFALTGMDGQLTFENDSKKDILKLDKVQIEKEAQWQDLSVEKEESFRTCLKMSF